MSLMWVGIIVGGIAGVTHAMYVYQCVNSNGVSDSAANRSTPIYYACWTFLLWIVAGTYLTSLWLTALILYIIFKAFR